MAEQKMQDNTECKSETHEKHLCHLMYEGFHYSHRQEYKQKAQNAQFICQNCGRTANLDQDLSAPVAL